MNQKISFILIHSPYWNFNKRSSLFLGEETSVPANENEWDFLIHSPLCYFFGKKREQRENEWEWMRFSHSFSLFQFFFRKNSLFFFPVSPPILPKKEKGRMNEVFSFILPFAFFGQKERGKGEWMREYHLFSRFIFFTLCTRLWGWAYMMGHFFLRRVASYLVVVLVVVDDNVDDDDDVFVISSDLGLGGGFYYVFFSDALRGIFLLLLLMMWMCIGWERAYIVRYVFSDALRRILFFLLLLLLLMFIISLDLGLGEVFYYRVFLSPTRCVVSSCCCFCCCDTAIVNCFCYLAAPWTLTHWVLEFILRSRDWGACRLIIIGLLLRIGWGRHPFPQ